MASKSYRTGTNARRTTIREYRRQRCHTDAVPIVVTDAVAPVYEKVILTFLFGTRMSSPPLPSYDDAAPVAANSRVFVPDKYDHCFSDCLEALFHESSSRYEAIADGTASASDVAAVARRDPLIPYDVFAFRRAMLPALARCTGADNKAPQAYFAVLQMRSDSGAVARLPFAPTSAAMADPEDGSIVLQWLVSCDSQQQYEAYKGCDFDIVMRQLDDALPYGLVMSQMPEVYEEYGMYPRACAGLLSLMHKSPYERFADYGIVYVHLACDDAEYERSVRASKRARSDATTEKTQQ